MDRATRTLKREQARRALLDAAHALLEEYPWPQVTIERITAGAGVSRTAFYQHFRDRQDLLLTMFRALADDLTHAGDDWMRSGADPATEHRRSLAGLTDVFADHGRLLRAVSEAAVSDPDVAAAYQRLADGIVDSTSDAIARDVAGGHAVVADVEQMSRALSAMTERYLVLAFGHRPFPDRAVVIETLSTVWIRTLYPAHDVR